VDVQRFCIYHSIFIYNNVCFLHLCFIHSVLLKPLLRVLTFLQMVWSRLFEMWNIRASNQIPAGELQVQVNERYVDNTLCYQARHQREAVVPISQPSGLGGGGAGSANAPQKFEICWKSGQNPWKFGQNPWKSEQKPGKSVQNWRPTLSDFKKWRPRFAEKQVKTIFWRSHQKRSANFVLQLFGKVWAKILCTQKFDCSYIYVPTSNGCLVF